MIILSRILILCLITLSCQNEQNKDKNRVVTFDLKKLPKVTSVKLSELGFVSIKYIPLETNEQSMIAGINDRFSGNKIVAANRFFLTRYWNTMLEFQNDGSFVTNIGTVGRGPDEFTTAYDVNIDEKNHRIYILCERGKKFNVYSERGDFLRTFQIPFFCYEFTFIEDGILCYSENHFANIENSYNYIDTTGRIIKYFHNKYTFNKHKDRAYFIWHENLFYKFNNMLFKKEVYSDTVYVYENMCFKPHLVIEVGEKLLTPKARSEYDGRYLAENYIDPINLFEFGDYIYYEFGYSIKIGGSDITYGFIGSKKKNFQALINSSQGIINDLDGGPNILPGTTKDDNTIIAWVDVLKLKAHVASDVFKKSTPKYPEKKKELEKLANSLKETDNPVLVMVKLKK